MHVVKSVIEYFNEYGSSVYLSALDITKAFDRLNNCAVLLKMKQIGVPVGIIIVFWYWFQHSYAVVIWCGAISSHFDVKSGIRLGGVSSCWIFTMVFDGLITKFEKSGYGCHFQSLFAGCILFAGDVMLLSASLCKLECMLNMYAKFAEKFGLFLC